MISELLTAVSSVIPSGVKKGVMFLAIASAVALFAVAYFNQALLAMATAGLLGLTGLIGFISVSSEAVEDAALATVEKDLAKEQKMIKELSHIQDKTKKHLQAIDKIDLKGINHLLTACEVTIQRQAKELKAKNKLIEDLTSQVQPKKSFLQRIFNAS